MNAITPEDRALLGQIVAAIDRLKGMGTVVFDVRGFSVPTSYMVITSADNPKQLRAIAETIAEEVPSKPVQREGWDSLQWIVMDYGGVIVHVMSAQAREFYDLEGLWGGTPVALD